MTKMATMPIYGKNPLKIFFPGTSGTVAMKLGMTAHHNLLKLLPWVDLDLFFGNVKFSNFYIENAMDSLEIISAFNLEIG